MSAPGYIHGESDAEGARLLEQAEILAPYVLEPLALDGVTRLIEIGVGVGAETRLLLRRWPRLHITGVDRSEAQIARARRTLASESIHGRVELRAADATALPFPDAHFDGALFVWVLEHTADADAVMREAARVLAPGGRLFAVEVFNRSLLIEPRHAIVDEYFAALSQVQAQHGGHPNIGAHLPRLARRAGLDVESFGFAPVMDRGDRAEAVRLIRYFEGILRSAEDEIVAAGAFARARVPEVWRAFDAIVADPDCLLCYTSGHLVAVKPG